MVTSGTQRGTPSRLSHVIAVLVNVGILVAVNWWPGWEVVPFLSQDMSLVLGIVNLSIVVNLTANLTYLAYSRSWLKALGDLVTLGVGTAALVRIWQVFPFAFSSSTLDWTLAVRSVLVLGIIGSIIGMIVACTSLARTVTTAASDRVV